MNLLSFDSMSDDHQRVHALVAPCLGKRQAMPVAQIVRLTGIGDRRVRSIVKELVEDHGFPIASCPSGFFVPQTEEEIDDVLRQYLSWGFSLIKRAYGIKKNPRLQRILGQLELELGESGPTH